MDWIQTYLGHAFSPLEPQPEQVDIRDIAHSLAMLCRFNGHCLRFYSVAEHAVRVSHAVEPAHALAALLHDAGEAYLSDLPRPVKRQFPTFDTLEEGVLEVVMAHFGVSWPLPDAVWAADDVLLATEMRDLMAPPPAPWGLRAEPLPERIEPVDPAAAERLFLARFEALWSGGDAS